MPDIGASLRNARTRAGIDLSDIEAETKIRAKYLRALENEEWNQLPGPTYVRGFLRTYGDALGLDGRMLVEEYKLRHQSASEQDMRPIAPVRRSPGQQRRRMPVWAVVLSLIVVLVAALWVLGRLGNDNEDHPTATAPATTVTTVKRTSTTQRRQAATPAVARVRIAATAPVFVCATNVNGRRVLDGVTLQDGQSRTLRSQVLRIRFGNGSPRLTVNGRRRRELSGPDPQAYRITATSVRRIPVSDSPSCGA